MKILGTNKNQQLTLCKAFQVTLPGLCHRMVRMWRPCGAQELSESLQWWCRWRAPRRRAFRSGLGAQHRPSHNAPRGAVRWKCPPRPHMQGFICERSHMLLISNQYPVALRLSGEKSCCQPPRALWARQNGTPTLWVPPALCNMCIPRIVRSTEHVHPQTTHCLSCFLYSCFRRFHCVAQDQMLCDTKS